MNRRWNLDYLMVVRSKKNKNSLSFLRVQGHVGGKYHFLVVNENRSISITTHTFDREFEIVFEDQKKLTLSEIDLMVN